MSDPITVVIPRRLPSLNTVHKRHWSVYAREKKIWKVLMLAKLRPQKNPDHMMYLRIVSHRCKLCDVANLVGGAKPIPDLLIDLGYLHDDGPDWMIASYDQVKCKTGFERTEITVSKDPIVVSAETAGIA